MSSNAGDAAPGRVQQMLQVIDDDIVISGIGGRYPEADNVNEFWDMLVSGKELTTKDNRRWPVGFFGLPERQGKVKNVQKFDHDFFDITESEANCMDAQMRLLLETTHEAVMDAGLDPATLRGSNTGMYCGLSYDDTGSAFKQANALAYDYLVLTVQRMSHVFDFKGPGIVCDSACASSLSAFRNAFIALKRGICDQAIVCGAAIQFSPEIALAFHTLSMLSDDGRSKCLDVSADGYARSEAVIAILLQRKKDAKRVYATIVNTKTNNDGFKPEGVTFPSMEAQRRLMQETYAEVGINPHDIKYMEAHMTGTSAGDPVEGEAIFKALCTDRKDPLLMGCLKSNIGHTEAASGMCAISKVCLALEKRELPPNLHMKTANPAIEGLRTGLFKPVNERMPLETDLVGVNSFGFGGCNVHTILRAHNGEFKEDSFKIADSLPRLINICGRTPESVEYVFDYIKSNKDIISNEFLALLNNAMKTSPERGMKQRGFAIFNKEHQIVETDIQKIEERRPVWFTLSGISSSKPSLNSDLLKIKPIALSIERSARTLKPLGINLTTLILPTKKLSSFTEVLIATTAIQVALIDLLKDLNIQPDGIAAHSIGEIAAAYADGCLTAEQTLLTAHRIGAALSKTTDSLLATVSLSEEAARGLLTSDMSIAWVDSADSVTVTGPAKSVRSFLAQQKIPATPCFETFGASLHSESTGKLLTSVVINALKTTLTGAKSRCSKWLSSSVPQEQWHETSEYLLRPEFFTNCVSSQSKFFELLQFIPKNATVVEIGTEALLSATLSAGLGPDISYIPMITKIFTTSADCQVLSSIGQIYLNGSNPHIENLYEKVQFPVPRGTPSLSPLLQWDHASDVLVTRFPEYFKIFGRKMGYVIDLMLPTLQYMGGHCVDGRILLPTTGYLWVVWEQLVLQKGGRDYSKYPIEFRDVRLRKAVMLSKIGQSKLQVRIIPDSGEFCITEGGHVCVTGFVQIPKDPSTTHLEKLVAPLENPEALVMTQKDIYKEFRVRGYDYGPTFQGLVEAQSDGTSGKVKWLGNWVSFADSVLHLTLLGQQHRGLHLPTYIEYIKCDPVSLFSNLEASKNEMGESVMDVFYDRDIGMGGSKGLVVKGLRASAIPRRQGTQVATLEKYEFRPYTDAAPLCPKTMKKLADYEKLCESVLEHIFEGKEEPPLDSLREYIYSKDKAFTLLRELYKVAKGDDACEEKKEEKSEATDGVDSNNNVAVEKKVVPLPAAILTPTEPFEQLTPLEKLQKKLAAAADDLSHDNLVSLRLCSEALNRSSMDILVENAISKKLKVVEANTSTSLYFANSTAFMDSALLAFTEYFVIHPKPDTIEEEAAGANVANWSTIELSTLPTDQKDIDLLIYKDRSSSFVTESDETNFDLPTFLSSAMESLKPSAFMLLIFRSSYTSLEKRLAKLRGIALPTLRSPIQLQGLIENAGFFVVNDKFDNENTHALFVRKPALAEDLVQPVVISLRSDSYDWVEDLKKNLLPLKDEKGNPIKSPPEEKKPRIWLVAEDNPNGAIGLVNCLRREAGLGDRVRCLFNTGAKKNGPMKVPAELLERDLVMNVMNHDGYGSYRHSFIPSEEATKETDCAYLDIKTKGDLSSFRWFEAPHKYWADLPDSAKEKHNKIIYPYFSSLNFKDVMVASGRIPLDAYPEDLNLSGGLVGLEFAGRDESGKRVMGYTFSMSIATSILLHFEDQLTFDVPATWTMEQAATIPIVYLTVYYGLIVRAKLQKGESILIHAGSGGIGQAAINICQAMGCTIYTTCGSQEKRDFLKNRFGLEDWQIANSRDVSFEGHIFDKTKGRGVDVVLNSLSDEKLKASIRCLAEYGRFVEIGKYDIVFNNRMEMSQFGMNKQFHVVCLAHLDHDALWLKTASAIAIRKRVRQMLLDGIEKGEVKPLSTHLFDKNQAEDAFRFMATGKHIGKVVMKIRDEETNAFALPSPLRVNAIKQTIFHPMKSYIITGGLGGFGLELALWMASRGCRKFVLTSRTGPKDSYQKLSLRRFKQIKAEVVVSTSDTSTLEGTRILFEEAEKLGQIGGIFNLAMVLKDATLENQNVESFTEVGLSKVAGTVNLDIVAREKYQDLEYFVCFSSVVAGRGNGGQTNYGFANSVMERVCENRRAAGHSGLAIQWGAIGDVGVVAESLGGNDVNIGGTVPQRMPSCFETLDMFLQSSHTVCSSIVSSDSRKLLGPGKGDLVRTICHILGVKDHTTVGPNATLGDLGMDSLMAVEIKQGLEREYDMVMSTQEIRALKIKDLKEIEQKKKDGELDSMKKKGGVSEEVTCEEILDLGVANFVKLNDVTVGKPLFFFAGVDGSFRTLKPIAKLINRPVVGLNWTEEADKFGGTIKDIVKYFVHIIRQNYPDTQYDFVGYDMGGLFVLEITAQLQAAFGDPTVKKICLLDSAPDPLKANSAELIARNTALGDSAFYTGLLLEYLDLFLTIENRDDLKQSLSMVQIKEEKLRIMSEYVAKELSAECDPKKLGAAVDRYYKKVKMMNAYDHGRKFAGELKLLRANEKLSNSASIVNESDYGVCKLMDNGRFTMASYEGDHRSFLSNFEDIGAAIDGFFLNFLFA